MRSRWLSTCACVAAMLLLIACGGGGGGGATTSGPKVAPDFALEDIHGKVVRLSDSSGKVRLIDFWATWCAPCVEAIPHYRELHNELKDQGLVVIGISMDEGGADLVRPFAEKHQMTYTSLLGSPQIAESFGVFAYPTTFLVDGQGTIVQTWVGPVPKKVLEGKVKTLLAQGTPS